MFDPGEFLKRPTQEILDTLKALSLTRDELVVLARHLEIEPKTSSTKPEIRQLILPVLVTKNIVGEESDEKTEEKENTEEKEDTETSTMMVKTRKYDQEFELEKLKLQMELEKMRLEREEKEKERQERERERQEKERERQEKERERERQEKERERERQERERERQEKEREREKERQERERESARQIQEREKEKQFELEKLKLQQLNHPIGQSFDVIKNFQAYLLFKKMMLTCFSYISRNWLLILIGQKITGLYCCRKLLLERHEKSLLSCQSNSHRSMNMSKMLFFVAIN